MAHQFVWKLLTVRTLYMSRIGIVPIRLLQDNF